MKSENNISFTQQTPQADRVTPGAPWLDDRGKPIQAHGGGVIRVDRTWYWFGEDRSPDNDPQRRTVSCYASKDLLNWEFRNQVLSITDPEGFGDEWILERPKVFHDRKHNKFVMYMHIDGRITPDHASRYSIARVGIAVSDTIDGDYQYLRSLRPFGKESRDIGQFVDDDGTPYLIFECRPSHGFYIASLTEDCLDVAEEVAFIEAPIEGGAIVKHEDLYYLIGSKLTGWWPNPNQYATAKHLSGPWSDFRNMAPEETCTFGSQSTNLIKVIGSETTAVIYLGDMWRPYELHDSRYLWYPLTIGDGKLSLDPFKDGVPGPWSIDVKTGQVTHHS